VAVLKLRAVPSCADLEQLDGINAREPPRDHPTNVRELLSIHLESAEGISGFA
jgi:hypothetical protein